MICPLCGEVKPHNDSVIGELDEFKLLFENNLINGQTALSVRKIRVKKSSEGGGALTGSQLDSFRQKSTLNLFY